MNKEGKVFFKESFNLETYMSGGDNWINYVDEGPKSGRLSDSGLAIKEFDPTILSVMNFAEPEAFKALICPLGLEELRAVV